MKNLTTLFAAFSWTAGAAFAQVPVAEPVTETAPDPQPTEVNPVAPPAAAPVKTKKDVRLETSEDESIYVLQHRAYTKRGKLELTPTFFTSVNPRFVNNRGGAVALTVHLKEGFGLEFMGSFLNQPQFTNLVFDINNYTGDNISLAPDLVDYKKMTAFGAASAQFSALYGKFELYDLLVDYDLYITTGVGFAQTQDPQIKTVGDVCEDDYGYCFVDAPEGDFQKLTGNVGAGFRFFFNDFLGLRLEVRDIIYADRNDDAANGGGITTDIRNNVLLFAGVSVMTPKLFGGDSQ